MSTTTSKLLLMQSKVLKDGHTLELYYGGDNNRVVWVEHRKGRKPSILDFRDFTTPLKALAFYQDAE